MFFERKMISPGPDNRLPDGWVAQAGYVPQGCLNLLQLFFAKIFYGQKPLQNRSKRVN